MCEATPFVLLLRSPVHLIEQRLWHTATQSRDFFVDFGTFVAVVVVVVVVLTNLGLPVCRSLLLSSGVNSNIIITRIVVSRLMRYRRTRLQSTQEDTRILVQGKDTMRGRGAE